MYTKDVQLLSLKFDPLFKELEAFLKEECFKDVNTKDGYPYYLHCLTVANFALNMVYQYNLQGYINLNRVYITALCHDVIEDCPNKVSKLEEILYKFFGSDEIFNDLAYYLTFDKESKSRKEYIENISNDGNIYVLLTKLADLTHNSLISRVKSRDISKEISRIQKYMKEFYEIFPSFSEKIIKLKDMLE